ncbi:MAG: DinB family protein [Bacteroidota bacterium]
MKGFYKDKFQYTFDKNQEMIAYLIENESLLNEKIQVLISHILNAHEIWMKRILKTPTKYGVWQLHDYADMAEIDAQNFELTKHILAEKDLNEKVDYKTSTGESYTNVLNELLFHVVNHSSYHRAQINTELKNLGLKPLITDYVFYKRT